VRLFHYTCHHSAELIDAERLIRPHRQVMLPPRIPPVVWLTDIDVIDDDARHATGLTSTILKCDRTERRYAVEVDAVAWRAFTDEHHLTRLMVVQMLEVGRQPDRWWVMTDPISLTARPLLAAPSGGRQEER
jgi:hypothetical protein